VTVGWCGGAGSPRGHATVWLGACMSSQQHLNRSPLISTDSLPKSQTEHGCRCPQKCISRRRNLCTAACGHPHGTASVFYCLGREVCWASRALRAGAYSRESRTIPSRVQARDAT